MTQGERTRLFWLCAVSAFYCAAVSVGDNVAQSIFVARLGVGALPTIFLLKAAVDVLSAICYLPLTRRRNPRSVWRALLALYVVTVGVGWWAVASDVIGAGGAYLLYAGHEVVWTLTVIHWGIFLLDIARPDESKKLFPILFGVGRLGALVGGLLVGLLAIPLGAANLLGAAVVLALLSALASTRLGGADRRTDPSEATSVRSALASPLVRAIALSTATMVVLRYGLRMVSLAEIRAAFDGDKDEVAAFLGAFSVVGNALAFVLGLYLVPRLLRRVGVGTANLLYAGSTFAAFLATTLMPSLATASAARFVEVPLKHALKTPLSVLFYGAERKPLRAAARSLVFGAAIPLATVAAGLGFRNLRDHLGLISGLGLGVGAIYFGICVWQNRCYRRRLWLWLEGELGDDAACQPWALAAVQEQAPALSPHEQLLAAKALSSEGEELRSQALLALAESLSHRQFLAAQALFFDPGPHPQSENRYH